MTAKLRGHHLICLNFFRGEGYSEEFIKNIHEVLKKEKLEIVEGSDDVCEKCPYLKNGKCRSNEYTDEMIRAQDRKALGLLGYGPFMNVDWKMISDKLPYILAEWKNHFCFKCGYKKVCFSE